VKQAVKPEMSIVIATHNNRAVLERCLDAWRRNAAGQPIELLVIADGCTDGTEEMLKARSALCEDPALRWFRENDVHELVCTNRGFAEARAPYVLSWHDDMFVQCDWLIPELLATFGAYPEIGLVSLSRGLICRPLHEPIRRWEDLSDWRRLESTIGPAPWNWFYLQEVDAVMRPWTVRREAIEKVGPLDEAFRPTEYDELDLCFRLRRAGWLSATHGYERVGAYQHLGSSTLSRGFSDAYKAKVLRNGLLFHERWDQAIAGEQGRIRRQWIRRCSAAAGLWAVRRMGARIAGRVAGRGRARVVAAQ
jgi:GT2 family glycosyltransferase